MDELKLCPFCGGEAFVYKRYDSIFRLDPTDFTVLCKDCNAGVRHYFPTESEAIATWNRRADAVPVVRCKYCKFGDWDSEPNDAMVCMRTKDGFWRSGNDFCSFGERKEGAD